MEARGVSSQREAEVLDLGLRTEAGLEKAPHSISPTTLCRAVRPEAHGKEGSRGHLLTNTQLQDMKLMEGFTESLTA